MKVDHAFKAKMEAFRERFCAKVENELFFAHLTLRILDRDESRFPMMFLPNLVPNSDLNILLAGMESSASSRDFACSLLSINLMEFQ